MVYLPIANCLEYEMTFMRSFFPLKEDNGENERLQKGRKKVEFKMEYDALTSEPSRDSWMGWRVCDKLADSVQHVFL